MSQELEKNPFIKKGLASGVTAWSVLFYAWGITDLFTLAIKKWWNYPSN